MWEIIGGVFVVAAGALAIVACWVVWLLVAFELVAQFQEWRRRRAGER